MALIYLTARMVKELVVQTIQHRILRTLKLSAYGNNTQVYYSANIFNDSSLPINNLAQTYRNLLPADTIYTQSYDINSGKYSQLIKTRKMHFG